MDELLDEDSPLSDDSDYNSDQSEISTNKIVKVVSRKQIRALTERSKVCVMYSYYSTGNDVVCTSCMINLSDHGDIEVIYSVKRHEIELHAAVNERYCSNCRRALYLIFQCNMCPVCTQ